MRLLSLAGVAAVSPDIAETDVALVIDSGGTPGTEVICEGAVGVLDEGGVTPIAYNSFLFEIWNISYRIKVKVESRITYLHSDK